MKSEYRSLSAGLAACLLAGLAGYASMARAQQAPASSAAMAAQVAVPMAPADVRPELKDLLPQQRLIGKTRLTVWGFQVYDARLWSPPGVTAAQLPSQPFALELAYLRDFDNTDIAARSLVEMRRSASISAAQADAWTVAMLRVFPMVKKGDRIMGVNQPGVGALFLVNGKPAGEIRDTEFARLFFGIWLSDKTSEPDMRDALLAGAR